MKRILLLMGAVLALSVLSCAKNEKGVSNDNNQQANEESSVKVEIRIEDSGSEFAAEISHTIHESEMVNIEVQYTPAEAPRPEISYSSDATKIARVSRGGTVTGRGEGKTDIHVYANGKAIAVCHLTVGKYEAKVQSFSLDVDDIEVEWGKTEHVVVKRVYPLGIGIGDVRFKFTSSDPSVLTVENDADGWGCKVKGIKPGNATIHASVDNAEMDISATITKRKLGIDRWRFLSPLNNYDTDKPDPIGDALAVYYPAPVELFVYDETLDHNMIWQRNGVYRVVNHNKATLAAGVDSSYQQYIMVLAKGDGSSDDEGWGKISIYYEDDLYVSAVENLEVEFRGCVAVHGDMTLKRVGDNTDLCASTTTVTKGSTVSYRIARKSNKAIKGIYRFNTKKDWIHIGTSNCDLEESSIGQGGEFTCTVWWHKTPRSSCSQIAIGTEHYHYGWIGWLMFYDKNMIENEGFAGVVDDELADIQGFIAQFTLK